MEKVFSDEYIAELDNDTVSANFNAVAIEINGDYVIVVRTMSACGHINDTEDYVPNPNWTLQDNWSFAESESKPDDIRQAVIACDEWFATVQNHITQIKLRLEASPASHTP